MATRAGTSGALVPAKNAAAAENAAGLLSSGFMSGMPLPSLTGGDAGPSSAWSDGTQSSWMASPFAVGAAASATANPTVGATGGAGGESAWAPLLLAGVAVLASMAVMIRGRR